MGLLPENQKDQAKVAAAVVGLALAAFYYQYPYTARVAELEETLARVERLESQNAKAKREVARGTVQELKREAERSRATLAVLRRLVPTVHEVPGLLEQVSTAARRAGLELGGVSPEPVLQGDQFDTHRYKVTVVGSYHALTTFLANAGSLSRIVAPVTFALVPSGAPGSKTPAPTTGVAKRGTPLQATVTIQTYVAHAGAPAAAPSAAAGPSDARAGEVQP